MTPKQVKQWKKEVGNRLFIEIYNYLGNRKQHVFAKLIGISQGSLSDILNGKSAPSALTLKYIAEKTDIDIVKLIA